jgi:membrane protein YdbS with pleckstrin-like domain
MKGRNRLWIVAAVAAVLIVGHGVILYYFSSHFALSAAVAGGVAVLIIIKHLGLLGPLHRIFRFLACRSSHSACK